MLPTRTLGTEGLTVSCLGLGLMGMSHAYGSPGERDERESIATIHRAVELGCTFLDTAEAYGPFRLALLPDLPCGPEPPRRGFGTPPCDGTIVLPEYSLLDAFPQGEV